MNASTVIELVVDDLNLAKNVYGIKFVIKQIVPQNNEYNRCIIDDIRIFASNKLNQYGIPMAVEDIYVRKNDANCRNFYNMKVNEYIWRLPNSPAEWKEVSNILKNDVDTDREYINENALTVNISRLRSKLADLGYENIIETRKGIGYRIV